MPYPRSQAFRSLFRSVYGKGDISAYVPLAYDAVWLFADAIKRSGSLDPVKIRSALAATQEYQGATGRFSFKNHGDPVNKGASIHKFKDDRWVFYKAFDPK